MTLSNGYPHQTTDKTADAAKLISTNLTGFTVPFKADIQNGAFIEVHLYLSKDLGKSWNFYAKQDVTGKGFKFTSDGDGEYWFALRSLDRNRQLFPSGNIVQPELRIVVDTKKPQLEFSASADPAGRIVSEWKIVEAHLDPANLKLSHRDVTRNGTTGNWLPVTFRSNAPIDRQPYVEKVAWWPQTQSNRIEVRLEVADFAGNVQSSTQVVTLLGAPQQRANFGSTTNPPQSADATNSNWVPRAKTPRHDAHPNDENSKTLVCENGVCQLQDAPADKLAPANRTPATQTVGSEREFVDPPIPDGFVNSPIVKSEVNPAARATGEKTPDSIPWESQPSNWSGNDQSQIGSTIKNNLFPKNSQPAAEMTLGNRFQDLPVVQRPDSAPQLYKSNEAYLNLNVSESTTLPRTGKSQLPAQPVSTNDSAPSNWSSTPEQPIPTGSSQSSGVNSNMSGSQVLNINTRRFNLNYDIRAIDPSGVAQVILWGTRDGGATWKSLAADTDKVSPFPVEVPGEGVYGYRIVVNSNEGLTGTPPRNGEGPEVTVNVDLTTPVSKITSAPFGSGPDVGKLIIQWDAKDANLQERPIRLSYSLEQDGPWTTIADKLRNTGSYAWKVPSHLAQRIYLKLEARDLAQNVGIDQLLSPLDLSGLMPRGQILSVDPIR
jgi:hypothetical protein